MPIHFLQRLPRHIPVIQEEAGPIIQVPHAEDVSGILQKANASGVPIVPDFGGAIPNYPHVRLDVSKLNRVRSYRDEEFLITTETGMTCGQLAEILEARNQRMALTYAKSRSLLSLLGEETLSLSGTRYGSLRQWVVGIEAVTGDGEPIHYGGEVVKNVTGYEMSKLFIGSLHRYGLLTSVTLKVELRAEMTRSFLFHIEELNHALDFVHKLTHLLSNPEILTLFRTKNTFGWQVLVTLSGYKDVVHQESELIHEVSSHLKSDLQELYLSPKALEQWVQKLDWQNPQEPEALVIRMALGHKQVMDFPYRFLALPWLKTADMLTPLNTNQLVFRWISVNMPQKEDLLNLQAQVSEMNGFVEILRKPQALAFDVEGFNRDPQPAIQEWEKRLKDQFDPNRILSGEPVASMPEKVES